MVHDQVLLSSWRQTRDMPFAHEVTNSFGTPTINQQHRGVLCQLHACLGPRSYQLFGVHSVLT